MLLSAQSARDQTPLMDMAHVSEIQIIIWKYPLWIDNRTTLSQSEDFAATAIHSGTCYVKRNDMIQTQSPRLNTLSVSPQRMEKLGNPNESSDLVNHPNASFISSLTWEPHQILGVIFFPSFTYVNEARS